MPGILAALDFGPATPAVMAVTADLAQAFGLPVHLLHVRPPAPVRPEHAVSANDPEVARRLRREKRDLDNGVLQLRSLGLDVSVHQPRGDRAAEIVGAATTLQARYLVLGAREPSALRHLMAGSVPAEVVRRSPVPVIFAGAWQRIRSLPDHSG